MNIFNVREREVQVTEKVRRCCIQGKVRVTGVYIS